MTEHPHMPPIHRYTARWLCPGKLVITVQGIGFTVRRDDALNLAVAITEILQVERW